MILTPGAVGRVLCTRVKIMLAGCPRNSGRASCRAAARSDVPQAQINLPAHMEAYMWNRVDAKKSTFLCIKVSVHPRAKSSLFSLDSSHVCLLD